jgi:hypothetical protein
MQNNLHLFTPPKLRLRIAHENEIRTKNCRLEQIEVARESHDEYLRRRCGNGQLYGKCGK